MPTLAPCPSCNRHVRSRETCPFCGALASDATASPLARSSRAALFALATAACSRASVEVYGSPSPPALDASATSASATATTSATPSATVPPSASQSTPKQ